MFSLISGIGIHELLALLATKSTNSMKNQIEFYQAKLAYEMDPSDLFQALENGEDLVVLDARQASAYQRERIPSAINLPHREMNEETTQHLNRATTYVCYCDGIGCNASTKGALNMTRLGFTVKELIGGIEWWKIDGYATEGPQTTQEAGVNCAC